MQDMTSMRRSIGAIVLLFGAFGVVASSAAQSVGEVLDEHATRSKVIDGLGAARQWKVEVSVAIMAAGGTSNLEVLPVDAPLPTFVDAIEVDDAGALTIRYDERELPDLAGANTIVWVPTFVGNDVRWDCRGGTVPGRFRPGQCRERTKPR